LAGAFRVTRQFCGSSTKRPRGKGGAPPAGASEEHFGISCLLEPP
jgi:hypothetical protein